METLLFTVYLIHDVTTFYNNDSQITTYSLHSKAAYLLQISFNNRNMESYLNLRTASSLAIFRSLNYQRCLPLIKHLKHPTYLNFHSTVYKYYCLPTTTKYLRVFRERLATFILHIATTKFNSFKMQSKYSCMRDLSYLLPPFFQNTSNCIITTDIYLQY